MITYQVEPWERYYRDPDRERLWKAHYEEFKPFHHSLMPFGPDIESYEAYERLGVLQTLVARDDGRMVGYCLVVVKRHMHYNCRCGFEDSYYVHPDWRKGLAGVKLIRRSIEALRARGVLVSFWMTKEFNTIELILARLGMRKCDTLWVNGLTGD